MRAGSRDKVAANPRGRAWAESETGALESSTMQPSNPTSRRQFVQQVGLAAGAGVAISTAPGGLLAAQPAQGPDAVLAKLIEGNRRFIAGTPSLLTRRRPEDFASLAEGQAPTAIVVACADSRVAPELIFDQGVGDLFVVRVAGNVVTGAGPVVKGSLEFAVAELGARLILVLGHTACGAVKAAVAHIDNKDVLPGSIEGLVDVIRPAVGDAAGQPGDKVENVIKANVRKCVQTIKGLDPILAKHAGSGDLKVVGGVYNLKSGQVEILD
jgi:carbonic anhydrase